MPRESRPSLRIRHRCTLDAALDLWRRGLSVIPVPRPRPGGPDGKIPAIQWKQFQERRPTEDELYSWFSSTPMNIAIIAGQASKVVVVDADNAEALQQVVKNLPRTPWQTKTAKGYHMFYRYPDIPVRNRARIETRKGRLAIDVRGDGGYVIGPGSVHASGHVYEMAGDWSVPKEQLPVFWPGWIRNRKKTFRSHDRSVSRPTDNVIERARRYLAAIPRPEIGRGSDSDTLYAACRLTRGFGLSEADAVSLLWDWAGGRDGWTLEWIESKVRNAVRYGSEMVGALR